MPPSFRALIPTAGLALLSTGCALIVNGKRQPVSVTSAPTGAEVTVDGVRRGACPTTLDLDRKRPHIVTIQLAGFQPFEMKLERKVSGWVWGNVLFGGLVGLCIDASTGSMYRLTPAQMNAALVAQSSTVGQASGGGLLIATTLRPDPEWEKWGQLVR